MELKEHETTPQDSKYSVNMLQIGFTMIVN